MIATLLSGRLTFALGVAVGLAALVALDSERPLLSAPLAAATSFASPVAGFFLLLIGGTLALADERRRGAILGLAGGGPDRADGVRLPDQRPGAVRPLQPARHPRRHPLRPRRPAARRSACCGAAPPLYAVATLVVYAVPNAMGGNVVRLSNLAAGPVLALGLAGPRRRLLLALCAVPLLYWQWQGAVRDVSRAITDPAAQRSFYTPMIAALRERTGGDSGPDRDPAHPGPLGGLLHGAQVPARARLGAPARVRRTPSLPQPHARPLPHLAAGTGGQLRRPAEGSVRLPLAPRGGPGRRAACPT